MKYNKLDPDGEKKQTSLLVLGTLIQAADVKKVFQALSGVLNRFDCNLVVAGPVNATSLWNKEIQLLGLQNEVQFKSARNSEELAQCFKDSTLFLDITDSDKRHYEQHEVAVLEAMKFQRPVVTSWQLEFPTVVEHGKNGMVAMTNSPKDLAAIICFLLSNEPIRRELGKRGYCYVNNFFDFSTLSQAAKEAFKKVTKYVEVKAA